MYLRAVLAVFGWKLEIKRADAPICWSTVISASFTRLGVQQPVKR